MNLNKENIDNEKWLPVIGYEGLYEVSNFGRVRRASGGSNTFIGKIMKLSIIPCGYQQVGLHNTNGRRTVYVQCLVAESFIGPRPPGEEVNHIDGDKTNNNINNLEYVTHSENVLHAFRTGLCISRKGEENHQSVLTEDNVHEIRSLLSTDTHKSIGRRFGVSRSAITDISIGRSWGWLKVEDTTNK